MYANPNAPFTHNNIVLEYQKLTSQAKCVALLRSTRRHVNGAQAPRPKSPRRCEQTAASVVRIVPDDSHSGWVCPKVYSPNCRYYNEPSLCEYRLGQILYSGPTRKLWKKMLILFRSSGRDRGTFVVKGTRDSYNEKKNSRRVLSEVHGEFETLMKFK